ncbi:MAG TPA: dihydrofolate reductase family protein, partial [Candidatus Limnocylindria bacterium]|nr:dihydrofolate reductase family protein [Candidatus Limnocylindria bacterium]
MRLIATSFVTLDGVMEGPGFDEHRDGKNAWALRIQDEETERYNLALVMHADAILLGRTTYQIWAAFWPTMDAGDRSMAEKLNAMPKYVASNTLERADWNNTTVLRGDVAAEVGRLKAEGGDGDLLLYGSADLLAEVMKHDLVDEYRLQLYPVVLGSGKHLFRDRIETHHLRLTGSRVFPSGIVLLIYEPEASAPAGPYAQEYTWTDEQIRSLQAAQDADRILATVLFTDVVASTARAAEMGDRAWRQLIDRHFQMAQAEVHRWMGQHIESTGDGIMATFDTPTRALRCAFALHDVASGLGLELRAAMHTGEIER